MEDLLQEEDFLSKPVYNPWKGFMFFYLLALLQMTQLYIISEFISDDNFVGINALLNFLLPIPLAVALVFYKNKKFLIPIKTLRLGLTGLAFSYMVAMLCMSLVDTFMHDLNRETIMESFIVSIVAPVVYWILFQVTAIPIVKYKIKRIAKKGNESSLL